MSRETDPVLSGMSGRIADYRLDGYLGQGVAAVVYLAQDERSGRNVALKVLTPELARDDAFRAQFLHEARAAAAVNHPHIIPVYAAGEANGSLYLAMHYVPGGDARSLLNRFGPLPFAWAWTIIAQVASALDAAHAHGLIHRDVKPSNMLLDTERGADGGTSRPADGSFDHVYLSDFGTSTNVPPGEVAATGQFAGALDYVAPEQIEGRAVDGRADLYALASAGFELLCGTPPFGQDQGLTVMYAQMYAPPPSAAARRPELPAAVDQVLGTALAKNPADRYATCGQFADELRAALGLAPGQAEPAAYDAGPAAHPAGPAAYAAGAAVAGAAVAGAAAYEARAAHAGGPAGYENGTAAYENGPNGYGAEPAGYENGPAGYPTGPAAYENGTAGYQNETRELGYEPVPAAAPVMSGSGWPPSPAESPTAGMGAVDADPMDWPNSLFRPPPAQPPLPRRPGRRLILAVAAGTTLVVLAIVGVLLLQGPSGPPAGSTTVTSPPLPSTATAAAKQAATVNGLLRSSAATRRALIGAVAQVHDCARVSAAVSQIQQVVDQRSTQYHQASVLSAAALANGATVKSDLLTALRNSMQADRDYLTWAQQQLGRCRPGAPSAAYNAAFTADRQADAAKGTFVVVWNPVAAKYGLPAETSNSF
jgi:Protein kinase domain